jgi:uncharacterized protein
MFTALDEKKRHAISVLRNHRAVAVALSGGVDSAALLAIAREALGRDHVVAITGRSPAVTDEEIADASRVAEALGVRHEIVTTGELDNPSYRANRGDRCFHCRSELFAAVASAASALGIDAVAYGAIVDDLGDYRPGMDAARKLGILAPLLESSICKSEVRELTKSINLHVHAKPASACLSSRIAVGIEVTPDRLRQVADAEAGLRRLGLKIVRVRHHGEIARIELGEEESQRIAEPSFRAEVAGIVRDAGFRYAALDLEGYRSGSLNPSGTEPHIYSIGPMRLSGQ